MVVRVAVTDLEAFISWVLGLLDHAEVLAPAEVRRATVDRLRSLAGSGALVTGPSATADRLRRLLAILAWLSQVGEAPIDEVADRFGLAPSALVSELELAACCGLPPYTPDQLMEIVVSDTTVSARLGSAMGRPRRLSPQEGFALAASARALLSVPGSDPGGALSGALDKLERALGGERLEVELDAPLLLPVVQQALADGATLAVTYYSASTDRQSDREITPRADLRLRGPLVRGRPVPPGRGRAAVPDRPDQPGRGGGGRRGRRPGRATRWTTGRRGFDAFVPGPDTRTVRLSVERSQAWMLESVPSVERPGRGGGPAGGRPGGGG